MSSSTPSSSSSSSSVPSESALAALLFSQLDSDGDGWLSGPEDLAAFIEDPAALELIWAQLDQHKQGRINLADFERCFHMFSGANSDEADEEEDEEAHTEANAGASMAAVHTPGTDVPAGAIARAVAATPAGTASAAGKRSVSFGGDVSPASPSAPVKKSGGILIPPAGTKTVGPKPQNMTLRPGASQRLLLKKGYASLKHALILDELRSVPSDQMASVASPPPASLARSPSPTMSSSPSPGLLSPPPVAGTANGAPNGAAGAAAGVPPKRPARGHTRQQSSTDWSFQFSKSHTSLMQRAKKILSWCSDTESADAAAAAAEKASGASTLIPRTYSTISFPELETTIHYLARALTPSETQQLQQLLKLHGVPAVPVMMFREVITELVEQEEADKAALLRAAQAQAQEDAKTARAKSTPGGTSTAVSVSPTPQSPAQQAAREFNPEAFVARFLALLQRKVEMVDVKIAAPAPTHNPNVLASFVPAPAGAAGAASAPNGAVDASASSLQSGQSEGELMLSQLRQNYRLLENDSRNLRQKYEFNLVFTKQLEAENFSLRERLDEAAQAAQRRDEALAEARDALETHKALVSNMERVRASLESELALLREEASSRDAMAELERKRAAKQAFELERLKDNLQNLQHVRNAASKAQFREGLEEMRRNLGALRFQRRLQEENARVGLIEQERNEAIAQNQALQATMAEQQRILNELQREKLLRMGDGGSARGERALSQIHSPLAPLSPSPLGSLSSPTSPLGGGLQKGRSLLEDMDEEANADADANAAAAIAAEAAERNAAQAASQNAPSSAVIEQAVQRAVQQAAAQAAQQASVDAELHAEQLDSVRQQLFAAQTQLQSSRNSRVQSETALATAQQAVKALEVAVAKKDAELAAAQTAATQAAAQARAETESRVAEGVKQQDALKAQHETALASLRAEQLTAVAALESQHKEALTVQKDKLQADAGAQLAQQLSFLQSQHSAAIAQQDAEHKAALAAVQAQLDASTTAAKEAVARASADLAALQKKHDAELARAQSDATRSLDALRSELETARAATRTAEAALLAARQAARDHVCAVPQSAAAETQMLQSSLSSAQALSRELEQQVAELQTAQQESTARLALAESQAEEALSIAERREAQTAKQAVDLQAELSRTKEQLAVLQVAQNELTAQHAAVQLSLRQSKASSDELTLQLSSLQSHTESTRESHAQQVAQLSKLVDQWQAECERRKQAAETARKDAARSTEELERRIRELEHAIASHVCVGAGAAVASTGQLAIQLPTPSPPPASIAVTHVLPALGSPLATGALTAVPATTAVPAVSPAPAPTAAPVVVSTVFSKDGLSSAHVLELHAYATFISRTLGMDPDLRHLFPLDLASAGSLPPLPPVVREFAGCGLDLLRKLRDGLLIAKLINCVAPGTIDARVLNKRGSTGAAVGARGIVENLNVVITSAKSLGITMRVPQEDIAEGAEEGEEDEEGASVSGTPRIRRVSVGEEGQVTPLSGSGSSSNSGSLTSPTAASAQYVGVELGSAQLVLMQADTSLENLDIALDFLFQLLRHRMLHSAFGPEKSKVARLAAMLRMPRLSADAHKAMLARTLSLMPAMDSPSPVAAKGAEKLSPFGASAAGTRRGGRNSKGTMSKFATLSKALPGNLSSTEHKRFVAHFTSTILADVEQTSELNTLTPEQLLLRWINWSLLQQVASGAPLVNQAHYVAHLSDMDVTSYALLLSRVDAWRVEHGITSEEGPFDVESASSASVLAYMQTPLQVPHFHTAASVATRHERLNQLLLALLFQACPMMEAPAAKVTSPATAALTPGNVRRLSAGHERMASISAQADISIGGGSSGSVSSSGSSSFAPPDAGLSDEEGEASILKSYLNSCGIAHVQINHLFTDVRTGLVLLRMLDWLEPGTVEWKQVELNPSHKLKCISNLNLFLQLCRDRLRLPMVNIGAVDVYSENNSKYVLAIIWQLLRYNTLAKLKEIRNRIQGDGADNKEITDQSILEWANAKVKSRPHELAVAQHATGAASWSDSSLRSSLFLLNLLDNLQEGCVEWSAVEVAAAAADGAEVQAWQMRNARYAISVCRKLGAELFALPQDIVHANRKQLVLVLASLMACEYALAEAD